VATALGGRLSGFFEGFRRLISRLFARAAFHFTAGLLSGLCSAVLLQPADLLKTRLQQEHRPGTAPLGAAAGSRGNGSAGAAPQRPLVAVLRAIAAEPAPVRTLWRGTLPSAVRTSVGSALYFGGLDWLRRHAAALSGPLSAAKGGGAAGSGSGGSRQLSPAGNLATGALARAAAGFALMPVTVVKVRAESSGARPLFASTAALWRARGLGGFFAGSAATALRDAPYAGLYVVAYEAIRRRLAGLAGVALPEAAPRPSSPGGGKNAGAASAAAVNFSAGALAAAAATAATNPFDVVKTRVQLSDALPSSAGAGTAAARRTNGMAAVALRVVRDEGWRRLFDGLALRVTRKALSSALAWTVYEELVRRAEARWIAAAAG
jgi:solute carrier family 25 protein 38